LHFNPPVVEGIYTYYRLCIKLPKYILWALICPGVGAYFKKYIKDWESGFSRENCIERENQVQNI